MSYKVIGHKPSSSEPWCEGSCWDEEFVDEDFQELSKARMFLADLKTRELGEHETGFETLYLIPVADLGLRKSTSLWLRVENDKNLRR